MNVCSKTFSIQNQSKTKIKARLPKLLRSVGKRLIKFFSCIILVLETTSIVKERLIAMCPSQAFLRSCFAILIISEVSAFLLYHHTNPAVGHQDNSNYTIYTMIYALGRTLQKLETSVNEKTTHMNTLLRQVLITVNEMDDKIETSYLRNMSFAVEELKCYISS